MEEIVVTLDGLLGSQPGNKDAVIFDVLHMIMGVSATTPPPLDGLRKSLSEKRRRQKLWNMVASLLSAHRSWASWNAAATQAWQEEEFVSPRQSARP
jgi:hypothetical protein